MSEQRQGEVRLTLTEGTSEKEYRGWLTASEGGWHVDFAYGRRDSTLKTGRKTSAPLPQADAEVVLAKLLASKEAKGYSRGDSGVAYQGSELEGQVSGQPVQLLNHISEAELEALLADDEWVAQEKFNGQRRLVEKSAEGVRGINKRGLYVGLPVTVETEVGSLPVASCVLDSESMGSNLRVFDVLEIDGNDLTGKPYWERLAHLEALLRDVELESVTVVTTAYTEDAKRCLVNAVRSANGEGVVLKAREAAHSAGRPNSGGAALKFKFYATASALVMSANGTKRSVRLAMLDGHGREVPVGNVTVPPNMEIPEAGALVEVRYLYATPGNVLYQPTLLEVRTDIVAEECTLAQLKYEGAVAA